MSTQDQKTILVADSCACGLALFRHYNKADHFKWIYLADGANNPFGTKDIDQVQEIVFSWLETFREENLSILVIACNTASLAIADKKESWQKMFGIKIIDMFDGLSEEAKEIDSSHKVAIMGTPLTVKLGYYSKALKALSPNIDIVDFPAPQTERLVSRNLWEDRKELELAIDEIEVYKEANLDSLVLACTCYEMSQSLLEEKLGSLNFINPMKGVAKVLAREVESVNGLQFCEEEDTKPILENLSTYTSGEIDSWSKNLNSMSALLFQQSIQVKSLNKKHFQKAN